ncbi:MAG: 1-deoxy-D-xylulose-5-phosphate synthase [Deltaproteobacteria bacterium]|nr:1-deoxy-D-xylulose-5-phosphate synthase [Deltaproteobacteria bacterium]
MSEKILQNINSPADLKKLSTEELGELAAEVRELIIDTVSKTGGHLASSLGAVELTLALHYVLNTPEDKIIWDVGHQAYAHKIITGRRDEFHTLRQYKGISGFPKIKESPYDAFGSGHSSTSISAALGMATASDIAGKDNKAVAVIGDGSMTAGLAFEGLNQAGHLKKDLVVILNDNEMSIAENVGALSSFLSKKITGRFANKLKGEVEGFFKSIPKIGEGLLHMAKRAEDSLITLFTPGMLFEGLGFHYVGPIDGHNMNELIKTLQNVKELKGPVLVHTMTKKGKGYTPAEEDPATFHGVGPFDKETGKAAPGSLSYTKVFSSALIEIAKKNDKVVAITAAMPEGTGLSGFAKEFPERFFDVGIAEQHAITFAAGLSREGFVPVTAIYSTFLQRAYDEVVHDICTQELPIVIALDRAGLVGADGPTHHGTFDISYLRHIPNMVVMAPKDAVELRDMLSSAVKYKLPVAIRYPRGGCDDAGLDGPFKDVELGRSEVIKEGSDVTIIAIGTMVEDSVIAAERLQESGVSVGVVNARFVKPLDAEAIINAATTTGRIVTVEEGALQGGFGSAVMELLEENGVGCDLKRIGIPDKFIEHGTQLELKTDIGLNAEGIEKAAKELMERPSTGKKLAL